MKEKLQQQVEQVEDNQPEFDSEFKLYICDADEHMLDPMEQIKYALNDIQVTYGPVIKLRDAP